MSTQHHDPPVVCPDCHAQYEADIERNPDLTCPKCGRKNNIELTDDEVRQIHTAMGWTYRGPTK